MTIKKSGILTTTAIFLSCMSLYSHAITYRIPVIASAGSVQDIIPAQSRFYAKMYVLSVNDETINETDTVTEVMTRRGYDASAYVFGLYLLTPHYVSPSKEILAMGAYKNKTWREFTETLVSQATSGTLWHSMPTDTTLAMCLGSGFYKSEQIHAEVANAVWYGTAWNGFSGANLAGCANLPPTHQWCALDTPELSLSHGEVNLANGTNVSVSDYVSVECTNNLNFSLRLATFTNTIVLNNGMVATLTMNDKPLGTSIGGKAGGGNTVKISSNLAGTPNKTGPFEGSGVLMLYYP